MQKTLIIIGLMLLVAGIAWPWLSTLPLGRLPGDLIIRRDNVTFYFPVTSMILLSVLISAILWLFRH